MMRNREKWFKNRRDVVESAGYCYHIPGTIFWRTPQPSQLALCFHLMYLRGIEACVEYPISLNNSQCYLDVWIPMALLNVEIDGSQHGEEEHSFRDEVRDHHLNKIGIDIVRFSNEKVWFDFPNVISEIVKRCKDRDYAPSKSFVPYIRTIGNPATHYSMSSYPNRKKESDIPVGSKVARTLGLEYAGGCSF
jgi:hypothetical protein